MRWYLDEVLLVEDSVVAEDAVDSAPEIGCVGVEREAAGDEILEEEGCDAGAGFEASGFGAGADDLACSVGTKDDLVFCWPHVGACRDHDIAKVQRHGVDFQEYFVVSWLWDIHFLELQTVEIIFILRVDDPLLRG